MTDNKDIAVLAKKVYELSVLPVADLEARKWEALLILNAVYSSATPEGIDKANADKVARWGAAIQQEGLLSRMHPKWHLRTDDGKPPAARFALESALTNPSRDLRARLATLQFIAPADRPALGDLARALIADAFGNAQGVARQQYLDVVASLKTRFTDPWPIVLPNEGEPPPVMILIDNQGGALNDGGVLDDDPSDDPLWANAIRTWNVDFLRDNPLAQFYLGAETVVGKTIETAGQLAEGASDAAKGFATLLKWAPYVLAGIGAIGATAIVLAVANKTAQPSPTP
ncbi:MAG: hypothetical protein H0T76_01655 [Nannocystis sp.]|nr:hypothetical protein [Nannocystis sp.]MBA3545168.1 hypothetical protein [Nannocystis sp.]